MKKDMWLELKFGIIGIVVAIAIIAAIVFALFGIVNALDSSDYNNGICKKCGGKFEYIETVGTNYGALYIYGCNKCGYRIEQSHYHYEGE